VVTICCTQKLLRRIHSETVAVAPESDTLLGDWYANILFARTQHVILCVSERTLLPIVVTASAPGQLGARLTDSLQSLLLHLGVSRRHIESEVEKMNPAVFAPTRNKRLLGTINSFMVDLSWYLGEHPRCSLIDASLHLAETPCAPINYDFPERLVPQLFANSGGRSAMQ
jgi:hypothetical protein